MKITCLSGDLVFVNDTILVLNREDILKLKNALDSLTLNRRHELLQNLHIANLYTSLQEALGLGD